MKNIVKNNLDKICKTKITLSIEPKFQKYEIFFGTLIENKALLTNFNNLKLRIKIFFFSKSIYLELFFYVYVYIILDM